jgi:thiaminase
MNKQSWTLTLLVLFLCAWLYTEIAEYWERDTFRKEVHDFMNARSGNRFTAEEGAMLKSRIEILEKEHENREKDN